MHGYYGSGTLGDRRHQKSRVDILILSHVDKYWLGPSHYNSIQGGNPGHRAGQQLIAWANAEGAQRQIQCTSAGGDTHSGPTTTISRHALFKLLDARPHQDGPVFQNIANRIQQ